MIAIVRLIFLGSMMLMLANAQQKTEPSPYEDALRESVKQFRAGKIKEAREALHQAAAILEKIQGKQVDGTLPDAPEGWSADEMKIEDVSEIYGGGKVVKKNYKQKTGQAEVNMEIFYGSKFIALMRGMLSSEAAAKSQGFEIKRAGGEQVLVKNKGTEIEVVLPLEEPIMVKLVGKDGAQEKILMSLIRDIDLRSLKGIVK